VLPGLEFPRTENSAVAFDAAIWLLGGFGPNGAVRPVERFDPADGRWEIATNLPARGVNHAGLAAVGGRLFVLGGNVGVTFTPTDAVRMFDPVTSAWSEGRPMPEPRSAHATAVMNGRIHVIGGVTEGGGVVRSHRVYDPATDGWSFAADMPTSRHGLGAATLDGAIYVVGGGPTAGLSFSSANERFTP